jgi:signal recognition particle subunit SRP72
MQGGRDREAQGIYNSVLKNKPSDIGLVAVVSNNLLTLNKDQNIFDSKKKVKAATVEGLEHKLTSVHRAAIARNNALLAMYTNQVDLCKSLITELAKNFDNYNQEEQDLILAGVLSRSGKVSEAVELLLKGKKRQDLKRVLIAVQVHLEKGEVPAALGLLEGLPAATKCRTGLLSTMVSLCLASDNRQKAAKLLKEAVGASQKSKATDDMALVWRKAAEFHLKGDEPSVAAQSLEELLKLNPNDKTTLAQLVLAYAKFDLKKAMDVSKQLPDFVAKSVDVEALEASAAMSRYGKKAGAGGLKPASPKPQTPEQVNKIIFLAQLRRKLRSNFRRSEVNSEVFDFVYTPTYWVNDFAYRPGGKKCPFFDLQKSDILGLLRLGACLGVLGSWALWHTWA